MGTKSLIDIRPIVVTHYSTLRDSSTKLRRRDIAEQFLVPIAAGLVAVFLEFEVSVTVSVALLTLSGIFAAFFFQLSVQILNRAAEWAEGDPPAGASANQYAQLLEVLGSNSAYAALIATLSACAALAAGISTRGWTESIAVALVIALTTHLVITLLLVSVRVFLLMRARLNAVLTRRDSNR